MNKLASEATPAPERASHNGGGGRLGKLRNHMQAVSAEGRLYARHFQPHSGKGEKHIQENRRLHGS